jgi:hypothetical protein
MVLYTEDVAARGVHRPMGKSEYTAAKPGWVVGTELLRRTPRMN